MNQISVETMDNCHNDLFVVNAARVSHNKWITTMTEKDSHLLKYLADHQHTSPFRHVRIAFRVPTYSALIGYLRYDLNPYESAGLIIHNIGNGYSIVKHSFFGWVQIIHKFWDKCNGLSDIYSLLCVHLPESMRAFEHSINSPMFTRLFDETIFVAEPRLLQFNNPWLLDLSFRCRVPLWLSRQLAKHQVGMSWNEVSRRYVSSDPELFQQEFRAKPTENIKQGSGNVISDADIPELYINDEYTNPVYFSIHNLENILLDWYSKAVAANIAPETIRGYMPQNMMTEFIWSGYLPAWAHMVKLRLDNHAQKETQYFAQQVNDQIAAIYPDIWNKLMQ